MTHEWRDRESAEEPTSAWLRQRYEAGSCYVLNLDHYICSPDLARGLCIEWKHVDAVDKVWRATRTIARQRGWYSACFEYETDSGSYRAGNITTIWARFCTPDGTIVPPDSEEPLLLDPAKFDRWVRNYIVNGYRDRVKEIRGWFEY